MTPYFSDPHLTVYLGDCREAMAAMEPESVHCVVTSPPYWGLRDYGTPGQLGLEPTPEAYVEALVGVFREVRRVLRRDGTVWLNLGDSYGGDRTTGRNDTERETPGGRGGSFRDSTRTIVARGLKPKDLVGIPWRVAFALQADGWYLRSDIIWAKPNPMPESVTDRPTKSHEYVFLLSKSARYWYDADAVREANEGPMTDRRLRFGMEKQGDKHAALEAIGAGNGGHNGGSFSGGLNPAGRNLRSVWTIATQPYPGAHFATFPEALVEPCVKAGTSEKGVCPECGAPWKREVERGQSDYKRLRGDRTTAEIRAAQDHRGRNGTSWERGGNHTLTQQGTVPSLRARPSSTIGWSPTCRCRVHARDTRTSVGDCNTMETPAPSTKTSPSSTSSSASGFADPVPATILDPFAGSGTTGLVANRLGRRAVLIDLSADYLGQVMERNAQAPLGLGA